MKKLSVVLLFITIAVCVLALPASAETIEGWNPDSPALASIMAYVEAVTDETSESYIPPQKRVVLFDSDGTLIGERYPTYSDQCMLVQRLLHDDTVVSVNSEDAAFAAELEKAYLSHQPLPDSPRSTAQMAAESFAGFTVEQYTAYVREFLKQPIPGFTGMTYGERFFVPMVGLVKYLAEHDFQVFICSGTERLFVREVAANVLGDWIPPYRIIGSSFSLKATGQGETADRSYTYTADDQVLLGGNITFKNVKMSKVISIVNEIGMDPILVFGNSSGDFAMAQYALQHGGKAYMLLCDDTARDYGDEEEAAKFAVECAALGFETVSMRDEFTTIYAEGVRMDEADGEAEAACVRKPYTEVPAMKKLFDEIPYLEGERVILRKITEDDRETLQEMARSNNIYRYEPTYLLEQQYDDMDLLLRDLYGKYFENKQNLFLGVFLKENPSELCGLAEFYDYRDHLHMVSIGARLREKFWHIGIATEIAKLMSDYLFYRDGYRDCYGGNHG